MTNIMKYETDNGEITLSKDIVKRYLVSGQADRVTDQEVVMFMQMCKYQNLNPFLREAYLIKFGNSPATMVTGKDTFVKRAAKSPLCTGYEAGVIVQRQNDIEYRKGALVLSNETLVGGWAKVYRKDWQVPFENTVGLNEYERRTNSGKPMSNWAKMPGTMIRKVALVQALREAIPEEFSGLYSPEEMPVDDSKLNETPIEAVVVDENLVTDEQLRCMYNLAKEKNVENDFMQSYIFEKFDKHSSKELTKDEADQVIKMLEDRHYDEYAEFVKDFKTNCNEIEKEHGYEGIFDDEDDTEDIDLEGTPFEK